MKDNLDKFFLYNDNDDFKYNNNRSDLNIKFNRIAFIFFFWYIYKTSSTGSDWHRLSKLRFKII